MSVAEAAKAGAPLRPPRVSQATARARFRLILFFSVVLLLVGLAGAGSVSLLEYAIRPASADDLAQRVCTIYQQQDYTSLVQRIDSTPIPPANPGPFDAVAQRNLVDGLRGLDTSAGTVRSCSYRQFVTESTPAGSGTRQYVFQMQRGKTTPANFTTVMTLVRQTDTSWKIARSSNFLGGPTA